MIGIVKDFRTELVFLRLNSFYVCLMELSKSGIFGIPRQLGKLQAYPEMSKELRKLLFF